MHIQLGGSMHTFGLLLLAYYYWPIYLLDSARMLPLLCTFCSGLARQEISKIYACCPGLPVHKILKPSNSFLILKMSKNLVSPDTI